MDENAGDSDLEQAPISVESVNAQSDQPIVESDVKKPGIPKRPLIIGGVIVLILLAVVGIYISATSKPAKKVAPAAIVVNTQSLSPGTLSKLEKQAGAGGAVTTQLVITPNTLFKNNLEVQGDTKLDKNLAVGGNANVGGNLSVSGLITGASLSVGALTIGALHLGSDLNFGGHIVPNGTSPSAQTSVAAAGGNVTVSGSDTSGTVTINTGSGNQQAGELAVITFHTPFGTTPKVQLTPVNAASAILQYFVSQGSKFFTIQTASTPAANGNYTYNYLVTQ